MREMLTELKVKELLDFCNVPSIYLAKKTPKNYMAKEYGRGVTNRNEGLRWLRMNIDRILGPKSPAVLYFADDDNAYDVRLFEEIRKTGPENVSMFPVGGVADTGVSTPILHRNGSLIGYFDPFYSNRKYVVDMAGFAVGMRLYLRSNSSFIHKTGHLEDLFLQTLQFTGENIQFLAQRCTQILVWHVKTVSGPHITISRLPTKFVTFVNDSNLCELTAKYSVESL